MQIRIVLAGGFLLGTAALLSAQSSNPPTAAPTATTKKTATEPPAQLSDCANDGWRTYSGPAYKSQKACEKWVQKHVLKKKMGDAVPTPASGTPSSRSASTPVPRNQDEER